MPGYNSKFDTAEESNLTLTMLPDFTNEATAANSLYALPTVTASGSNHVTTEFTHPAKIMMCGGNPARHVQQNDEDYYIDYGLLPFPLVHDNADIYVAEPMDMGEASVPIFGYSNRTRQWWTDHYFKREGYEPEEGEYAEVEAFRNMYYASEEPLVINNVFVLAKGQVSSDVRLTARITALNDDFSDTGDIIAEAVCTYDDILQAVGGVQSYLTLVFNFSEPVVISTKECLYYTVDITGFTDGGVTWLAPLQSYTRDINGICRGWVNLHIAGIGHDVINMVPIANLKNEYDEYMYNSFVINLGATYPYLKAADAEAEAPELSDDRTKVSVPLLSWYPGEKLTVDVPEGFDARVEGRWNNAKLIITALKDGPAGNFTAKVKCPGIELDVPFSSKGVTVAINDILSDGSANKITAIYTADGRDTGATDLDRLPEGIYIVRYADGSASKLRK